MMEKIDRLQIVCEVLDEVMTLEGKALAEQVALAHIALHNAEREQERAYPTPAQVDWARLNGGGTIPAKDFPTSPQPQPFDCELVVKRIGVSIQLDKIDDGIIADVLTEYCRSLNIPVKNDPS